MVSAEDVGVDEVSGTIDRAVHMTLGGEMHDRIRRVFFKNRVNHDRVAEVGLDERVAGVIQAVTEGREVSGVSKFVEIDDLM